MLKKERQLWLPPEIIFKAAQKFLKNIELFETADIQKTKQ